MSNPSHFLSQHVLPADKLIGDLNSLLPFPGRYAMRLRLLLVTSVALLLAADTAKDEAANKKDRDKLQGSWSLVRGEQEFSRGAQQTGAEGAERTSVGYLA